jgi:excinuclease ABC subunit C
MQRPLRRTSDKKDYDANIEKARSILKGKTSSVIQLVKNEMKLASENLEFEKANELKNTLDALINYDSKSTVVNPKINNVSVFSIFSKEDISIVNYLKVVNGSVIQTDTIEYKKKLEESDQQILLMAIAEMEDRFDNLSKEILVPFELEISQEKYDLKVPKLGDKKKLLELSHKNSFYYYKDLENKKINRKDQKTRAMELLEQVKKDLDLKKVPVLIECFDNSNMQGSFPVAAMSVFKNGKPAKKAYRHFNIKTVEGPDDFASMEEVLYTQIQKGG